LTDLGDKLLRAEEGISDDNFDPFAEQSDELLDDIEQRLS
jgi:hypothetical protein